jgi:ketosteroid isomerase-like protein
VTKPLFPSAQDAEAAFYDAFAKGDLEAMMAVWADDDDIYCVHPQGPRLLGEEQVRESWRQIFASGERLTFHLASQHYLPGMMMAVHSVYEHIAVAGDPRGRHPIIATNVYLRTELGWRMVAHHASPAPAAAAEQPSQSAALLH